MAAGIAASRHFPEFQMISREGKSFFARRIGFSRILRSVPFRSGYPPLHCCLGRPPVETLPRIAARHFSFAIIEPKLDFAGRSGKWVRHWLSPLPRASSSLAPPFASFGSGLAAFPALRGGGSPERLVVSDRPLLGCTWKLCRFAESHKRIRSGSER